MSIPRKALAGKRISHPPELPISDSHAEKALVSSAIIDPSIVPDLVRELRSEELTDDYCRAVWKAIVELHRDGEPIDVVMIHGRIEDSGAVLPDGTAVAIADVLSVFRFAPHAHNWQYYLARVQSLAERRRGKPRVTFGIGAAQ